MWFIIIEVNMTRPMGFCESILLNESTLVGVEWKPINEYWWNTSKTNLNTRSCQSSPLDLVFSDRYEGGRIYWAQTLILLYFCYTKREETSMVSCNLIERMWFQGWLCINKKYLVLIPFENGKKANNVPLFISQRENPFSLCGWTNKRHVQIEIRNIIFCQKAIRDACNRFPFHWMFLFNVIPL